MTVFSKIIKIKTKNIEHSAGNIDIYLRKNPGISYLVLQNVPAIGEAVLMFIASSKDHERDMEDINKLILDSGITVMAELEDHKNNPLKNANHLIAVNDGEKEIERA